MPEMEVDRNKLLSQIKEAHGKVWRIEKAEFTY